MRYHLAFCGVLLLGLLATNSSTIAAEDTAPPPVSAPRPSDATAAEVDAAHATSPEASQRWRFKRHQGLWWYWLPSDRWVYWTGDKWVPYDAESYAAYRASQRQPSYSTAAPNAQSGGQGGWNGNSQGNWGPVHYDQYGTPQYPYSRRTTGIRQLGPVPAMGGVRSLPGWGGER